MTRRTGWVLTAAVALAIAPSALADEKHGATHKSESTAQPGSTAEGTRAGAPTPAPGMATTESGKADQISGRKGNTEIIRDLYAQNALDLETAKLAKERSQDEQVKQFADSVERTHARLGEKLEELASGRGVTLSSEDALKGGRKAHVDEMRQMSASEFDQHFREMMVADHDKLLNQVGAALDQANASGDRELAAVLQEYKPEIQQHHQSAMTLGTGTERGSLGSGAEAPDAPAQEQPSGERPTQPQTESGSGTQR